MRDNMLASVKNWVFDLDDTLYPSSDALYAQMCSRIQTYIMNLLHVDEKQAWIIQKDYYVRYGATVRGLMLEHGINPESFVEYVHQLDLSPLKTDKELDGYLKNLDARKFIFTNGAKSHALRVIKHLGIDGNFEGIFSISDADYTPKPAKETYVKMLDTFGIAAGESIMCDDNQRNLLTAHELGMKTLWINGNTRDNKFNTVADTPDFCDFRTPDLKSFLKPLCAAA